MAGISFAETIIILVVVLIVFAVARLPDLGVTFDRVADVTRTAAQIVEAEISSAPELPAPDERATGSRPPRERE